MTLHTTQAERDALAALAKAATPGPWQDDEGGVVVDARSWPIVARIDATGAVVTEGTAQDVAYIAAANPDMVARLLRDAERAKALTDFVERRIAPIKCRCDIVTMLPAGIEKCTRCEAREAAALQEASE